MPLTSRAVAFALLAAALSACAAATPQATNSGARTALAAWHAAATGRCVFHQYTPPPCGREGAYHRFYTSPGAGYINATWSPASNASTLPTPIPTSDPPPVPARGFLSVEGWPTDKLSGQSTEAGFQYDPAHNWFDLFVKPPGRKYWFADTHFAVAQLSVSLAAGTSCPKANVTCAVAAFSGTCYGTATPCNAIRTVSTPGWISQACCVLASMIAVVEPAPGRDWKNGAMFGPIDQSVCASAAASSGGCQAPGLIELGQRYPNDPSRVVVREQIPGLTGTEIDTIDLHP
jgi:hypothetical protein